MKLLWAPSVWEYCSALWCALRCWIFLTFHIVEHPDDFPDYTILNILSARQRSRFSRLLSLAPCVYVVWLHKQPIFIHWIFAAFQFRFFFSSFFVFLLPNEMLWTLYFESRRRSKWNAMYCGEAKVLQKENCSMNQYITLVNWKFCIQSVAAFPLFLGWLFSHRSRFPIYILHFICWREDKLTPPKIGLHLQRSASSMFLSGRDEKRQCGFAAFRPCECSVCNFFPFFRKIIFHFPDWSDAFQFSLSAIAGQKIAEFIYHFVAGNATRCKKKYFAFAHTPYLCCELYAVLQCSWLKAEGKLWKHGMHNKNKLGSGLIHMRARVCMCVWHWHNMTQHILMMKNPSLHMMYRCRHCQLCQALKHHV